MPVKPSPSASPKLRGRATSGATRSPLDRSDWIALGLSTLAKSGVEGLRVELLAKAHGVTKGSFYWHFRDRQDLLTAILEHWKEGRIQDIDKVTTSIPGKEHEQLHVAIDVYGASRNRKGMAVELAIRDWARHDPFAAKAVEAVDLHRLERTHKLFIGAGYSDQDAKSRSLLLYACVFGLSLMRYDHFDENLDGLKAKISGIILPLPHQ